MRSLPVLVLALLVAAVLPASALATPNPGQVELANGQLSYIAKSGKANNVTVRFAAGEIIVTDSADDITYGLGCHAGSTTHEVRCTQDDSTSSSFNWSYYSVRAGDGDDTVTIFTEPQQSIYGGTSSNVSGLIDGGAGNDTITGGDGSDSITGGSGSDVIHGGDGTDTADYSDTSHDGTYDQNTGAYTAPAGLAVTLDDAANDGNASDNSADNIASDVENVEANDGNDTLTGNAAGNRLSGSGGNDTINGGPGDDTLYGGSGFYSGAATAADDDVLNGNGGNDKLYGGTGGAAFDGGAGRDLV